MKPSPETPLDAYIIAEAAEKAGLPPGVLNLLPAHREAADYLVRSPGVDKISFTGSTVAGRRIATVTGERIARVTLELGGKSAGHRARRSADAVPPRRFSRARSSCSRVRCARCSAAPSCRPNATTSSPTRSPPRCAQVKIGYSERSDVGDGPDRDEAPARARGALRRASASRKARRW